MLICSLLFFESSIFKFDLQITECNRRAGTRKIFLDKLKRKSTLTTHKVKEVLKYRTKVKEEANEKRKLKQCEITVMSRAQVRIFI